MDAAPHKIGLTRLPVWAAAFVALVCVAIVALSVWTEWASREMELRNAEVELGNLARSLTQHAEDTVELADGILTGIVSRLETDGANPAPVTKLQTILNIRKSSLGRLRGLFVYDENGRWLATTETIDMAGLNNSDREYFRHHRESTDPGIFIGRPIHSRAGGQWVTTLSRRWNHADGRFGGVAVATVDAAYFENFYSQFDISEHGTIALQSADGTILARYPDDGLQVGRDVSEGSFLRGFHSSTFSGARFFRSGQDGRQRLGFYQRSDRYPLAVLASKAESDILARWGHEARARVSLVLGLVVLIAVIGGVLVRQLLQGQRLAAALAEQEAHFRLLAEGSSDMVTRIGMDERINYASPSSVRMLGWQPDQLVGTPALAGVNPEDLPGVEEAVAALKRGEMEETRIIYRTRHREKSEIWVESTLRITRYFSGEIDGVVAITRDMTEHKDLEERLATLATEDGLTGLANRRCFDERLLEEWGRASRERTSLALLMIDVDQFKTFNDKYGHPAGDECLRVVARTLAAEAQRTMDVAARYGGEEFAMLLPNTDAAGCARIGEKIRRAIREAGISHALNLPSGLVTASLGGAVCWPGTERSVGCASLVEAADRALYAAKEGGRDRLVMAGQVVRLLPLASAAG